MATPLIRNCCPRLCRARASVGAVRAMAKKVRKLRKAPPPPPPKHRTVCRYVFPYPKCIDLFSLRPEPECIEEGARCRSGNLLLLLVGASLVGIAAYLSYVIPRHMLWHNFDDDEECCEDD